MYKEGDVYTHPVLGDTLRRIAENGAEEFYTGETARKLVRDLEGDGGLMTMSDLENYRVSWETPVSASLPHTDLTLLSSPPPGSGSVLSAILGMSGHYQPSPPDLTRPTAWHRFVEACKFAFAQRTLLGDWNSEEGLGQTVRRVVRKLTGEDWWEETVEKISDTSTREDPAWYGAQFSAVEDGGTSHVSVLSPAGDAVSVTSTINTLYGSKVRSETSFCSFKLF